MSGGNNSRPPYRSGFGYVARGLRLHSPRDQRICFIRTTPRHGLSVLTEGGAMALADRLQDTPQRMNGLPCSVGALEERLEGPEADALHAMLHTLGWSARRVYEALLSEGYEVGQQTINRHRSRSCRCFKAGS